MRILIACDKFKGSLTATEACEAIRDGLREAGSSDDLVVCPIADGGEGFTESMVTALNGQWRSCESFDALHNPVEARYGLLSDASGELEAVLEMAEASGLRRIPAESRDVLHSSTFGTGSMIRDAANQGARRILVGIGGSATNDGGAGMLAALGVKFLDSSGKELNPVPACLVNLASVDTAGLLELPPIEVACDVENPLLGPNGASAVYAPQKGAGEGEIQFLEGALTRLVQVTGTTEAAEAPGAGAAGGLGFGLMCFAGARLRNGFNMVADALGLPTQVAAADFVVTGEGSLDGQTLRGKAPMGLALLAREYGKRVVAVGGRVDPIVEECQWFDATFSLESFGLGEDECMFRAEELVRKLGGEVAGLLRHWEDE
ncbi:MAG: glycerate kinase [Roseibacillus sp.]|nr:glycerate kinase [Roseibacillus sp.]MEE2623011.1 glycerate kinase [Verrucomicrobiota bacterium]